MSQENPTPEQQTPVDSGSQALAEALHSSFGIVKFVMAALFVVFLFSGFFQVGPQEKAIILRFGKPLGDGDKALLGSGGHWSFPYPIDEVVKIPITEIQEVKSRTSWFAQTAIQEAKGEIPQAGPSLNPMIDGYALTGDGNIVHSKATLRYRIDNPIRCVFDFASDTNQTYSLAGISNAVLNILDNALVHTAGSSKVDDALLDKIAFQDAVQRRVVRLVQEQKLGIIVDQCVVESRQPRQLDLAFQRVTDAGQKRSTAITQANTERTKILNQAEGDAVGRINTAQSERNDMVAKINGDAELFKKVLPAYRANPELFVQQRLVESFGRVFAGAKDKMFLPTSPDGKPIELRLNLNREPVKPKTEETK